MSRVPGIEQICIAGPTCSGKTSLTAAIERRMPAHVATLSLDEYDLFPVGSEAMDRELIEGNVTNWEDPAVFDMQQFALDVAQIAEGRRVKLQTRSRESLAAGETERFFVPRRVNIIEGIFALFDDQVRSLMEPDTYYVDIPLDLMVERRLAASRPFSQGNPWDDPEYIRGTMVEATRQLVVPQRDLARVVLDGTRPTEELADQVIGDLNLIALLNTYAC